MIHPTHIIPTPPAELQMLTLLQPRMSFSTSEKRNYDNLYKGYLGEMQFYQLVHDKLTEEQILLFDLLLESDQMEFQIDSMLITGNEIILLEIKNYTGDFYIDGDNWYIVDSQKEIRSPIHQIQRTEHLFKQLLQTLNGQLKVKSFVVFIHDSFTLYNAPLHLPAIFLSQLNRFITRTNANSSRPTSNHLNLVENLVSMHKKESANARKLIYEYDELHKGMTCENCMKFLTPFSKFKLICTNCKKSEQTERAIMRAVCQFNLLFPDKKITTNAIHEWCDKIASMKVIRRILMKNLKQLGGKRHSYYIFDSKK